MTRILAAFTSMLLFNVGAVSTDAFASPAKPRVSTAAEPNSDPDVIAGAPFFGPDTIDSRRPSNLQIWSIAPAVPFDGAPNYRYYPITNPVTQDIAAINASTAIKTTSVWLFWGDRCNKCATTFNKKPNSYGPIINLPGGAKGYVDHDNQGKADATTLAKLMAALGYPAHKTGACPAGMTWCGYLDATEAAGIPDSSVVPYDKVAADPAAYFTGGPDYLGHMTALNLVILPSTVLGPNATWVACDCEQSDNRLASSLTALIRQQVLIAHHAPIPRKLFVFEDSFQGAGQAGGFCGIGAKRANCDAINLETIGNLVDEMQFPISMPPLKGFTMETQIQDSFRMLGKVPASKLVMGFPLGVWPTGSTVENARTARRYLEKVGFAGVYMFPNHSLPGGGQCRWRNFKEEILLGLSTGSCPVPSP